MKKLIEKKWFLPYCAGILVIVIIIGIVFSNCSRGEDIDPTQGTLDPGMVEEPTETDPSEETIETIPKEDSLSGKIPAPPIDTPKSTDPTSADGEDLEPTDPDFDPGPGPEPEPGVADPTVPSETEPTEPTGYDFGALGPSNITSDIFQYWEAEKRQAFLDMYDPVITEYGLDTRFNYECATRLQIKPYCEGKGGIWAATKDEYDQLVAELDKGCPHCGANRCDAVYRDEWGHTKIDDTRCAMYGVEADPLRETCVYCGMVTQNDAEIGEVCCHRWARNGDDCPDCGEYFEGRTCHHCEKK